MRSSNGAVAAAVCGAFTLGGVAGTRDANCNVNGTPDAGDGIGILNLYEYAKFAFEAEAYLFVSGVPWSCRSTEFLTRSRTCGSHPRCGRISTGSREAPFMGAIN